MKKGYNVYYTIKNWDNNTDAVTIFFTENEEFAIKYVAKYNAILDKWTDYFLNNDTKAHELDRRDFIDSIVGCYYEEVSIRGEITTRDFSKKVLELQNIAKTRAYDIHLAKGGVTCYGGYNPKWDNFGIKVLLDEETTDSAYITYEQDIGYEYLDKSDEDWQKLLDNIKKEYVKSLDENNPILKRKKKLREEITQRQEELLELELKTL
jgi:hypothetical protein